MDIYTNKINPENYPEFKTRYAKAVTRDRLNNKINFVSLRGFKTEYEGNKFILKDISKTLDLYTKKFDLCSIIWPIYTTMFADNFHELIDEIKNRNLFLYDFWGYVPGSNPEKKDIWGEYQPPIEVLNLLYKKLGEKFLGFDNGEQDGRYIGSYSKLMCPAPNDRKELYKNFQAFFEKLGNHMNNDISLLSSLNFLHYFAKEGNTIMLNAETAQALPNANMWFSYIRGAGKQYGLLWAGNASVWNRWGYKDYSRESKENPYEECGVYSGTSLSLLRRLLYTEYMYNCDILGFEGGWLNASDELTPIGHLQQNIKKFVDKNGYPGVMYTPVALFLDFFNGYTPPRHLYSSDVFRVWGNNPYELGDYQIHCFFSELYPHYEDAGFYRNEQGFLTETPYGDMLDVIFSDTHKQVLNMYNLIFALGNEKLDYESNNKLLYFVNQGGHLVITIDKLLNNEELSAYGIDKILNLSSYSDTQILYNNKTITEKDFDIYNVELCSTTKIIAKTIDNMPIIIENNYGKGKISVILVPFGLHKNDKYTQNDLSNINNAENKSILNPYEFITTVNTYLKDTFDNISIIKVNNPDLQYSLNIIRPNEFNLLVVNNKYEELSFDILINNKICYKNTNLEIKQININDKACDYEGYTPDKIYIPKNSASNFNGEYNINPLDVQLYKIKTDQAIITPKANLQIDSPVYSNLYISYQNNSQTMKDFFLDIPSFKNYFHGIKIDSKYLEKYDINYLRAEAEFFKRQNVSIIIDFSSVINHYPDLSFLRNIENRTKESLQRINNILYKASIFNCNKAIFTIHRNAENHISLTKATENIRLTLMEIKALCEKHNITPYLQNGKSLKSLTTMSPTEDTVQFINSTYKFAYNIGHSIAANENISKMINKYQPNSLVLNLPFKDMFGQFSDQHLPINSYKNVINVLNKSTLQQMDFICLDAVYDNKDSIFKDLDTMNIL